MPKVPGALAALFAAAILVPAPAAAQDADAPPPSDGTALDVEGEVLDALTGRPLPGVLVVMHDLWQYTQTDELGYFRFEDVPTGSHEFAVYAHGYNTVEQYLPFETPGEILAVNLDPAPVEIEGLYVDLLSDEELEYRSFGQRYDYIGPRLMTEYREKYVHIAEMLRARFPAAFVMNRGGLTTGGLCVQMTRRSSSMSDPLTQQCAAMFIDGRRAEAPEVSALTAEEIANIRFLDRLEALLAYGEVGRYGVLLIETRSGVN